MQVGDKVIADGKPTEITAIAYDDVGVKIYNVAGSMKDYYEEELKPIEEKLYGNNYQLRYEELKKKYDGLVVLNRATLEEYDEQEKIIKLMAKAIYNHEDWTDTVCNIVDCRSTPHCNSKTEAQEIECIIEYYKNKAKELKDDE